MSEGKKILIKNKKARHEYFIEETYEAGLRLPEARSNRSAAGKANIKEAFVRILNNEAFIYNMHISPYEKGSAFNQDPLRTRKLLLHKKEIIKLMSLVAQKGLTLGAACGISEKRAGQNRGRCCKRKEAVR